MRPLFLLTNDDGFAAKGINVLADIVVDYGDVVVVAPETNASGKSHSLTTGVPMRVRPIDTSNPSRQVFACSGTPVDCVKVATEHICPCKPDLVLSGINHGSNSSINVIYSGTMGAALEAAASGYPSIGFSLLNHRHDADFSGCEPSVRALVTEVLSKGLPQGLCLNVNFPNLPLSQIKGMRVCRAAHARWTDSCERRVDPYGQPYYWLTGHFECNDHAEDSDQWALENGYVSIVPSRPDYTDFSSIASLAQWLDRDM